MGLWAALPAVGKAAAIAGGANLLGSAASAVASAKQAQRQMDFQERMSNTAYQRAAKDLEAAGLNRILALGSPATTPGGAMGQTPDFGAALSGGIQAGTSYASSAQQIAIGEQQVLKLGYEAGIQNQKLLQELAKTPVVQQVLKPVEQGASTVNEIIEAAPQAVTDLIFEMGDWGRDKLDAFQQIMEKHVDDYDGSRIQIIVNKIEQGIDSVAPNPFHKHQDIRISK